MDTNQSKVAMFDIEASHDEKACHEWMIEHYMVGAVCATLYAVGIYFGQKHMSERPRYELRYLLVVWNAILAAFSIMGTIRIAPTFVEDLFGNGLHYCLCDESSRFAKPGSYWGYLFALSKIYELGDTAFIILRKQQLIFLHYYHHITVLLYVWQFYPQPLATNRWFSFMNFFIHSIMYSYYALRAMKIRVPRFVNMTITFLQILQMFIGLSINIYNIKMLMNDIPCATNWSSTIAALAMYVSYFVLFLKFFYDAYMKPNDTQRKVVHSTGKEKNGVGFQNGATTHVANGVSSNGVMKNGTKTNQGPKKRN